MTEVAPTYSVFVRFRKGRLALHRRVGSLREALIYAEKQRMTRFYRPDDVFIGVDKGEETLTVEEARRALRADDTARFHERLAIPTGKAPSVTARAARARERALVAIERARTIIDRGHSPSFERAGYLARLEALAELSERAARGMLTAIDAVDSQAGSLRERGLHLVAAEPDRKPNK